MGSSLKRRLDKLETIDGTVPGPVVVSVLTNLRAAAFLRGERLTLAQEAHIVRHAAEYGRQLGEGLHTLNRMFAEGWLPTDDNLRAAGLPTLDELYQRVAGPTVGQRLGRL
jgi:hypothetical protein